MTTFVVGDTHFGHSGVTKFLRADGTKLRPWDTTEEMDEAMIANWNRVVSPKDKVYHLGDVVINRKALKTLERLNGDKVLIKGNHDCVDEETECLTKRGWLKHNHLNKFDLVLSLNPETGKGEWKPIKSIICNNHDGNAVVLETERMSMVITENHRVARFGANKILKYTLAKDLKGLITVPTSLQSDCEEYPISDDILKALAWVYTDGCLVKHKEEASAIAIYQSKTDGINRIKQVLDSCGITYNLRSDGITKKGTLICGKELKQDSLESFVFYIGANQAESLLKLMQYGKKKLSDWFCDISDRQARIFIEECIAGDGSWASNRNGNAAMLYGKKEFLDSVLILCVQKGINSSISVFREKDWRLNFNFKTNSKSFSAASSKRKGNLYNKEYKGVMWCIETEYTNFVVRRRGIPYVTGNCFRLEEYTPYFRDIRGAGTFDGFVLTHIPVHPDSLERWKGNIHGHLHSNRVMTTDYCHGDMFEVIDSRYLCVSMEHINYTPISWDEVKKRFEEQQ